MTPNRFETFFYYGHSVFGLSVAIGQTNEEGANITMMLFRVAPLRRALVSTRGLATRRKIKNDLPPGLLESLPIYTKEEDIMAPPPPGFERKPVTSAHCIDVEKQQVSSLDSAAISPSGSVIHGRYGDLGDTAKSIPLEYLALLRPAAEGCAGLRVTLEKSKASSKGTFLVYGAGQANGFAAAQVASKAGHAVVAVVGGEHTGNDDFMECVKGLMEEPGTAVPEEYALSKKRFIDLVASISSGDEGIKTTPPQEYLEEFKANFLKYVEAYPDTRPAAVSQEKLDFKYMEKDREFWQENMAAYLEQFPPGSPPVDKASLDANFSTEQYQIFRDKFWKQTTGVISGDDTPFSAPHLVKQQSDAPESLDHRTYPGAGPEMPYSFSVLNQIFPEGTAPKAGGPVLGALICVTPDLKIASEKIAAAKTLRAKGETLQFLTHAQRGAFGSACSVAAVARAAGAPVTVIGGSLPDLESVEATDVDVKEALAAMDIDDDGETRLNYFVQVYRGADFPFYADYGVHRATEELAGPRQIIVTK